MTEGAPDDDLGELVSRAREAFERACGGTAVCAVTRAGGTAPAAKYAEGRVVALEDVARSRRRGRPVDVVTARAGWSAQLEARRAAGAGPDWIAYLTGGVDALADLLERQEAREGRPSV